jgi:hypothetical protein
VHITTADGHVIRSDLARCPAGKTISKRRGSSPGRYAAPTLRAWKCYDHQGARHRSDSAFGSDRMSKTIGRDEKSTLLLSKDGQKKKVELKPKKAKKPVKKKKPAK